MILLAATRGSKEGACNGGAALGLSTCKGAVTPASLFTFTKKLTQPACTSLAFAAPLETFTLASGLISTMAKQYGSRVSCICLVVMGVSGCCCRELKRLLSEADK